jgi:DNA-binding MarR family transcriptional regulator
MKLTRHEQVLTIIRSHEKGVTEWVAPAELTQSALADATGQTRPGMSVTMRQLTDKGQVVRVLRHIDGLRNRRLVYVSPTNPAIQPDEIVGKNTPEMAVEIERLKRRVYELENAVQAIECAVSQARG